MASIILAAAAAQWQGQVGLFVGRPCYRCFVGDAFDAEDCDTCADDGMLGAMAGWTGTFAAVQAVRVLVALVELLPRPRRQRGVADAVEGGQSADCLGFGTSLAGVVAAAGGNITDLTTRLSGSLYVLVAEVELPATADPAALEAELARAAQTLGVEVGLRPIERDEL